MGIVAGMTKQKEVQVRAALYVRVSTAKKVKRRGLDAPAVVGVYEQNPQVQQDRLERMIVERGWVLAHVYSDRVSTMKERRPGLDSLMEDARAGKFDAVVVWRFDRFARTVGELVVALGKFRAMGVDFVSCQESLDTSTPIGKAMFAVIAAMAELERDVIRERVLAGMEYARRHGTKSGRPVGRPKAVFRRDRVRDLKERGRSWTQIAAELEISIGTARRAYIESTQGLRAACRKPGNRTGMGQVESKEVTGPPTEGAGL